MGSPLFSFLAFASTASTNLSATFSTTRTRLTAVQRCPEFLVAPCTASSAALSRSASSMTISGSVAAELQHEALVPGFLGDVLADFHAAGERDDVGVRVRDHCVAHACCGLPVTIDSICGGRPAS
jgi:hypothetical protein